MRTAANTAPGRQRGRPRLDPTPMGPRLPLSFSREVEGYVLPLHQLVSGMLAATPPRRGLPDLKPLFATTSRARAGCVANHVTVSGGALAIRVIGERLHAVGGVDLMDRVVERVAALDPGRRVAREGLLRGVWHGLGEYLG
jgi:hypothetical protein